MVGVSADARYTSLRQPPPPRSRGLPAAIHLGLDVRGSDFARACSDRRTGPRNNAPLDPALPVSNLRTQRGRSDCRCSASGCSPSSRPCSAASLLLAMIGLCGLLAYSVTRKDTTGIADGAWRRSPQDDGCLKQSLVLVVTGLAMGIPPQSAAAFRLVPPLQHQSYVAAGAHRGGGDHARRLVDGGLRARRIARRGWTDGDVAQW